jgi:acyl transferase domain-containing protein
MTVFLSLVPSPCQFKFKFKFKFGFMMGGFFKLISSSLHLACEAWQRGDCMEAIIYAANLILSPNTSLALDRIGLPSKDGSSKSFAANANGYARGEAVEAIYIQRLDDARRDGNPVRAVIRGTAINAVS